MQPRVARGTRTKEQILEAAYRLIHRQGFNNTSLDDILRESRVGKGIFYHHFRSKKELGYAVMDRLAVSSSERLAGEVFGRGEDPLGQIFRLFDIIVSSQREAGCVGGCPVGNLALEMSDIDDGFRERIDEILNNWRNQVAEAINRAQEGGQLARNLQGEKLAEFIIAGIEGAILLTKVRKDLSVLEGCLDELRKHVRMYLAA
ncbi:MAG: TetR/AcrR family transcriptional regulator [Candidatus Methylomirabilales bacterium]